MLSSRSDAIIRLSDVLKAIFPLLHNHLLGWCQGPRALIAGTGECLSGNTVVCSGLSDSDVSCWLCIVLVCMRSEPQNELPEAVSVSRLLRLIQEEDRCHRWGVL